MRYRRYMNNLSVATPSQGIVKYEYPVSRDVKISVGTLGLQLDAVIFNAYP